MATTQKKAQLMLLCDLNGTLGYRCENPVPGVSPLLYIRHKNFYPRHGVVEFLKKWSANPQFKVCIYSSVMLHNIEPILKALLPTDLKSKIQVFDQQYCKPDPDAIEPWDTIRDFNHIQQATGFTMKAILAVDNESRKIKEAPWNGLIIPEFGMREVAAKNGGTLARLDEYLTAMSQAPDFLNEEWDVREYIKKNPLNASGQSELSKVTESISKMSLGMPMDKLNIAVYGSITMRFESIRTMVITYHGQHNVSATPGSALVNVRAEGPLSPTAVLEKKVQLARLLCENKGLKVYVNEKLTPYEANDCLDFLKGIPAH